MPSSSFVLFGLRSGSGSSRIGITVTRKCGNAVTRNRIKRLLREVFRRHEGMVSLAIDVVVNARAGMEKVRLADLQQEFAKRVGELGRRLKA